jgi:hypothetical protein
VLVLRADLVDGARVTRFEAAMAIAVELMLRVQFLLCHQKNGTLVRWVYFSK